MKVLVLAALFMIASNGQAASTCLNLKKENNLKQLINFASETKPEFESQPDLSSMVVIDRTKSQYTQLNGIGIVTVPGENWYGTGFLVSPCHVLTNVHVVYNESEYEVKDPQDHRDLKIGKKIQFSVGQTDSTNYQFSNSNIDGKVVAVGKYNGFSSTTNRDWVVIKLSTPVGREVGYIKFFQMTLKNMNNRAVITAGYPGARTNYGANLKNIYGDLNCKMDGADIDGYVFHTCKTGRGSSGSPILALNPKDKKYYAIGMVKGHEGGTLTLNGVPAKQTEKTTNRNTAVSFDSGKAIGMVTDGDEIAQAIIANKCD